VTDLSKAWPTLREFLDAGGDLSVGWPDRGVLVEFLYEAPRPPEALRRKIAVAVRWSEMTLEETRSMAADCSEERHLVECRGEAWRAEMLSDSELANRVRALLTPEERTEGERLRAEEMSPHPITVGEPKNQIFWSCQSCGNAQDSGDAIIVGWCEGYSELDYEITYCRDCIAGAVATYDAGRVKQ
jgi:hypothetical protein